MGELTQGIDRVAPLRTDLLTIWISQHHTHARADEAAIRRVHGLAAVKSLFLMLMRQNGDRGAVPAASRTEGLQVVRHLIVF